MPVHKHEDYVTRTEFEQLKIVVEDLQLDMIAKKKKIFYQRKITY